VRPGRYSARVHETSGRPFVRARGRQCFAWPSKQLPQARLRGLPRSPEIGPRRPGIDTGLRLLHVLQVEESTTYAAVPAPAAPIDARRSTERTRSRPATHERAADGRHLRSRSDRTTQVAIKMRYTKSAPAHAPTRARIPTRRYEMALNHQPLSSARRAHRTYHQSSGTERSPPPRSGAAIERAVDTSPIRGGGPRPAIVSFRDSITLDERQHVQRRARRPRPRRPDGLTEGRPPMTRVARVGWPGQAGT